MRIAISSGHGKYVRGASGYLDEVDEARKVVETVADLLRSADVEVLTFHDDTSTSQNQNLNTIVNWHNAQNRTLDVSVHFNAYQTTSKEMGTECLYVTQSELAADLAFAMATAGTFTNRGPKYRSDLFFLNSTEMPAVLLEVCFVDSSADAGLYRNLYDDICVAIAETLGEVEIEGPGEPPEPIEPPPEVTGENRVDIATEITDVAVYVNGTLVNGDEGDANIARFTVALVGDVTLVINGEEFHNKPPAAAGIQANHTEIEATVFGGSDDPNYSAYPPYDEDGNGAFLNDTDLYVALPFSFDLDEPLPNVRVFNRANELSAIGRVADKGPWVVNDDAYVNGTARPIAETCHDEGEPLPDGSGPNAGLVPKNRAGIDLSPALARAIGISGKGSVDWVFVV